MLGDMIRREDLRPITIPWQNKTKTEAVDHLRTLFVERRVRLPQHDLLKQELQRFRARATPGGNFQFIVAGGAGHGDHASCLTMASRADLDGFVDRSPTKGLASKHEILDYEENESGFAY
jgi:phage FluMu gp28-like protein